jgi:hypothetical protein
MTSRETVEFNEPLWDERLKFVQTFYDRESKDYEDIFVDALPSNHMISVEYRAIKNKQMLTRTFKFPVDMLVHLSDVTTMGIAMDLLTWFRNDSK